MRNKKCSGIYRSIFLSFVYAAFSLYSTFLSEKNRYNRRGCRNNQREAHIACLSISGLTALIVVVSSRVSALGAFRQRKLNIRDAYAVRFLHIVSQVQIAFLINVA